MKKKKSYYKKKYKGVRYIAQRLTKYQKGKYKNYTQALPDARKIFKTLKDDKKKVILKNIWGISRTPRDRGGVPQLPSQLSQLSFFFELIDYPVWILRCSKNLYFVSEVSPESVPVIQGGTVIDYDRYFSAYVNYINAMKGLTSPGDNKYETDWLVTCTEPKYNPATKRFESRIISVDSDGMPMSYGFNPDKPYDLPSQLTTSDTAQPKSTKTDTAQQDKKDDKPDLERVRLINEQIDKLRQDVRDGFLSKEDYGEAVKELTKKMKRGGDL